MASKVDEEDYYAILGLEPGAGKAEVATAYRKRSLAVHPDRYKGDDPEWATAEFLKLTRAKEVLLDDKARAAFEALRKARDAHRAKQEAQHAGRKKMREELEEREEAAKRQRHEPSAEQLRRQEQEAEAAARRDLQQELERLRSSGRLGGEDGAAKRGPAVASEKSVAAATPASAGPTNAKLSLRWSAEVDHSSDSLGQLLEQLGTGPGLALAVVGRKAVLEMPAAAAHKLMARSGELAALGVRAGWIGAPPAAEVPAPAPGLPAGWRECTAPDGRTYYYHTATRQTQWSRPSAANRAPAVSAAEHETLESVTMMRLRQAGERQKMMQALASED